jgi:hypothetical protein
MRFSGRQKELRAGDEVLFRLPTSKTGNVKIDIISSEIKSRS